MRTRHSLLQVAALGFAAAIVVLLGASVAGAGDPHGASYCSTADSLFWFVQISDLHIGMSGSADTNRLTWILDSGKRVINPEFIVATGDLTDSTNGNIFGYPNGPYQTEWEAYQAIVDRYVTPGNYFDLPGNHDAYNDRPFAFYVTYSVQGRATLSTQVSWTVTKPYGTYHFLGVNSADNTGAGFSFSFPYGDHAGLDSTELSFISGDLAANAGANLTFVFGHHPVTDTGQSDDTWLFYGHQEFIHHLDTYAASLYGYGHTHDYSETLFEGNTYTGLMAGDGIHYDNVTSLGKSASNHYMVYAVDCDGVSAVPATTSTWPVVVITAPVNNVVGSVANPYAYPVPASATNFVRALVFDAATNVSATFRVDGGSSQPMTRVAAGSPIFQGNWDASTLGSGSHTIAVTAVGTSTRTDTIHVTVEPGATNRAPVAVNDSYSTPSGTKLSVDAAAGVLANDSDPDGDVLTASPVAGPSNGTLALNPNGSFSYVPTAGYSGADSFTYLANDGVANSNTATVSLTITPAQTSEVTITTATYTRRTKLLKVEATSTKAPTATLTVFHDQSTVGIEMSYNAKTRKYTHQATLSSSPTTVTVKSDQGGSATKSVAQK